ncbi:TPA: hypothetical protein ACI7H6_005570 [Escherichia coli]
MGDKHSPKSRRCMR